MCGLERIVVVSLSAGIRLLAGQAAILGDASRKAIVLVLSIVRFELARADSQLVPRAAGVGLRL